MISYLSGLWGILLKIAIAFIIFLLGLIIGKFAGMIITKLLYELQIDQILETIGVKFFLSDAAGKFVSFAIYVAGIIFALAQLGLARIVTIALIAIFSLILIAALFFDSANAVRNLFAGFHMRKRFLGKKALDFRITKGRILKVGFLGIKIVTAENDILFVPFSALED